MTRVSRPRVVVPPPHESNPPDDEEAVDDRGSLFDDDEGDRDSIPSTPSIPDKPIQCPPTPEPAKGAAEADQLAWRIDVHLRRLKGSDGQCKSWWCPKSWTGDHRFVMVRHHLFLAGCLTIERARAYLKHLDGGGNREYHLFDATANPVARYEDDQQDDQGGRRFHNRRQNHGRRRRNDRQGNAGAPQG